MEQELWHTLCVSITLTWRSQSVSCSQLWTLLIIFVHLQKIAQIREMFLMLWAISFSLICLRLICTHCVMYFLIGQKKKWAWYFQMHSNVCLQVFHFVVWETIHTLPIEGFCFNPHIYPSCNSCWASHFPLKLSAVEILRPLGMSTDPPWVGAEN